MAIKIQNTEVIDNTRSGVNINSITFNDGTVQTTAGGNSYNGIEVVAPGSLSAVLDNPNYYDTSANDFFGYSVAISGNYCIVGAYWEDDAGGTDSGKAYIFDVTTGNLLHALDNPSYYSGSGGDYFGFSVAISGNYAIVGAYYEDDAGGTYSGKAYIFDVTTGNLVHALDNPNYYDTSANDYFGYTVSISGNYCIVGAYLEDDAGGTDSGKAYIYDVTTGNLVHALDNPNYYDTSANDYFGISVAISGNYAIVGANGEDDAGGTTSGKAYIFDVTTGNLVHALDNPNYYSTSDSDRFGKSVAISGNYAIAGARKEDDVGGTESGKAYIFDVTTGNLLHAIDNPNYYDTSASDNFGISVAISGNYAIVGAYYEDDAGGLGSGKAYIFDVTTGNLLHALDNPNYYGTSVDDYFGASVAISGNYAIVGAYAEDDAGGFSSGKAYIYDASGTTETKNINSIQMATGSIVTNKSGIFNLKSKAGALKHVLDNPNYYDTSTNDQFGISVAVSGNYCIVGAWQEDDAGGSASGKAYIFDVTTGNLVHTLDNPNYYDTSATDYFGHIVAISGNYCIVGAYQEDDASGTDSGKAYIYDATTGNLLHALDNPNYYDTSTNDYFGKSVAISGNYAIVGAYGEDDANGTISGKAYIYDVTTGNLLHALDNPNYYDTSASDQFGWSVAISGNYCIVGAYLEDDAGGTDSGKAYIFDVTTGNLVHALDNPNYYDTSLSDRFGNSVAISGNYAIVSAYLEDDASGSGSGKAYIYDVTTGNLLHAIDNPNYYSTSGLDRFGDSVAISDNYCIVGAWQEDDASGISSGKAYIYDAPTGNLLHAIDNPNYRGTSGNDRFGYSVAISGNYCIVGAYWEDDAGGLDSGKAYIYTIKETTYFDDLINLL